MGSNRFESSEGYLFLVSGSRFLFLAKQSNLLSKVLCLEPQFAIRVFGWMVAGSSDASDGVKSAVIGGINVPLGAGNDFWAEMVAYTSSHICFHCGMPATVFGVPHGDSEAVTFVRFE